MKKKKVSPKKKELAEKEVVKLFATRLKHLRKKAGHSGQLGFAYENDLNVRRYSAWEAGADIKLTNIARVCKALGISLKEFFEEGFD